MMKTCLLLLSAASVVKTLLPVRGRVGGRVSFTCSDWKAGWGNVKSSTKYLCESPCNDKDVIATASPWRGSSGREGRISIGNYDGKLSVTINNLQKSDSKTYFCGMSRWFSDARLEVRLIVDDAQPSASSTTAQTAVEEEASSTLSSAVLNISTTSLLGFHASTNVSSSTTTVSSAADIASYLVVGVVSLIIILVILLMFTWRSTKKKTAPPSSQSPEEEVAGEDAVYENASLENYQTASQPLMTPEDLSTLYEMVDSAPPPRNRPPAPSSARRVPDVEGDIVYSVAQPPRNQSGAKDTNQFTSYDNDCLYSLASL